MAKRRKRSVQTASARPAREAAFNNPFQELGQELKRAAKKRVQARAIAPSISKPVTEPIRPASEAELFLDAMQGAARIDDDPRGRLTPPEPPSAAHIPMYDEDAEVMAELAELVEGRARFDISDSDEFLEGCIEGLDRRILRRLRRGDFSVAAHLDLHGMTKAPARDAVETFVAESHRKGHRCVLIVHGRGLNSKDNVPVLKVALKTWLERGRIARNILAFCSARPHDGGAGAMYVLLRK